MAAGPWLKSGCVPSQVLPRRQEQKARREGSSPSLPTKGTSSAPPPLLQLREPGFAWGPLPIPGQSSALLPSRSPSPRPRSLQEQAWLRAAAWHPYRHNRCNAPYRPVASSASFWPPAASPASQLRDHRLRGQATVPGLGTGWRHGHGAADSPSGNSNPHLFLIAIPGDSYHQGIFKTMAFGVKQSDIWQTWPFFFFFALQS